jgi:hypothetical protein
MTSALILTVHELERQRHLDHRRNGCLLRPSAKVVNTSGNRSTPEFTDGIRRS